MDRRGRNPLILLNPDRLFRLHQKILTTPLTRLDEAGGPEAPAPYSPQWMWIGDRGKSKGPSPAGCGQVLHGRALKRAE